jgi:hypothetical protein
VAAVAGALPEGAGGGGVLCDAESVGEVRGELGAPGELTGVAGAALEAGGADEVAQHAAPLVVKPPEVPAGGAVAQGAAALGGLGGAADLGVGGLGSVEFEAEQPAAARLPGVAGPRALVAVAGGRRRGRRSSGRAAPQGGHQEQGPAHGARIGKGVRIASAVVGVGYGAPACKPMHFERSWPGGLQA